MATIKLAKAWTYRTPQITIDYAPGTHEVSDEIAAAAPVTEPEKDEADGSSDTAPRAPRTPRKTEG